MIFKKLSYIVEKFFQTQQVLGMIKSFEIFPFDAFVGYVEAFFHFLIIIKWF